MIDKMLLPLLADVLRLQSEQHEVSARFFESYWPLGGHYLRYSGTESTRLGSSHFHIRYSSRNNRKQCQQITRSRHIDAVEENFVKEKLPTLLGIKYSIVRAVVMNNDRKAQLLSYTLDVSRESM
jgi:hypothetical protein